jgi:signal transduction histidine kinase
VYFAFAVLAVLGFLLMLAASVLSARHQLALARDIGHLADQTAAIRSGNLDVPSALPEDGDLHQIAEDLSQIQSGLQQALSDRTRSERMKVELIANVSHDLKTPLTSILSYAELLRQEPLEGAAADYARIIDEKAQRLKAMVQDVFEISKAASDQLPVELERLDFAKLVRQTLADMADPIEKSGLTLRTDLPEGEVPVVADGKRLYRVFQNLIQNALQYSLPGSRIYLQLTAGEGRAEASIRNTSRQELPAGVDCTVFHYMAMLVRGWTLPPGLSGGTRAAPTAAAALASPLPAALPRPAAER